MADHQVPAVERLRDSEQCCALPRPTHGEVGRCALLDAVGAGALRESRDAAIRAMHDHYDQGRTRHRNCADSHGQVEWLLDRGHLLTQAQVDSMVRAAEAELRGQARDAQQMREADRVHYEQAERQLAAVLALIDVRRKTVSMDDLRRAVGDLESEEASRG